MTLQDTRAGGAAYVWISVFSCNQQDVGRAAPATPACTFLFKNWDNSTNIKSTAAPTSYTYTKASVQQFTNVQVLYIEYWIDYTVSGGDVNDLLTINSGYGNNGAYIGFSVRTPSATFWPNISPATYCANTCGVLSTGTGSANSATSVTMASTAKYYVRPTVSGSTATGTPHFLGGTVVNSGWQVIDNGFAGTNIAAGAWTVNLKAQTSYATNPITVDNHAVSPTGTSVCTPSAGGTCTIPVSSLTNDVIVLFAQCASPGILGTVTISDGNSLVWNTRFSWGNVGARAQGEWWAVTSGALSSDTVTATFTAAQTQCNLLYLAINGANTASPYDTNAAEPATVNANSPAACTMTTDLTDVILFGEVGQAGTPTFTAPSNWTPGDSGGGGGSTFEKFDAWNIIAGSVSSQSESWKAASGTNISGLCDAIVAAISTPGTANLWVSVFSCNFPNLGEAQISLTTSGGQVGQSCSPIVKNWDNSTNILSTTKKTYTYSFSGSAFAGAIYLYMEVWVVYTTAAASAPTVAFTVQDSSSSIAIPSGSTYYLTAQPTTCATSSGCENLFYYVGTQSLATTVNVATTAGVYQVRPGVGGSTTRGSPSTSTPDGYAWITEGEINGTIGSGTWKFTISLTDSSTAGSAFLWLTVWNCASPNIGQSGAGCTLLFKNWDNSTNIKSNAYSSLVFTTSRPAYTNVKYLAIEAWISETVVSGSSPDTITLHLGDSESHVRLPNAANRFYFATVSAMACAVTCRFFSSTTGTADSTTKVTVSTTGSVEFEIKPYATSATTAAISPNTVVGAGWETSTPMDQNVTAGSWRFNVTVSNTVASGTGNLWLKVYSCPDSLVGSPPNCVFLFKFYDNSTNILSQTASTKYSYTTPSEPLFHNVQYLYIEYWLSYPTAGTGDTISFTTVSAASSVQTPITTGARLNWLQVDSGKVIDSGTGQQQLRISTANKNSLVYLAISQATTTTGFTFVTDNANLTWSLRSVKIGGSDIMYVFYAIARNLLQGDVVTVGTGVAVQTAMSITIFTGENTISPFDSSGSSVTVTRNTFSTPACTASSCTLSAASNIAKNNLLVVALMYTVASATCNTFTSASDTFSTSFSIAATSTEVSGANCAESVIVDGYAGGSGSDTISVNYNTGATPGNQRADLFELLGVSTTLDGTSAGNSAGSTSVLTSGSVSFNTNDFAISAWTGLAAVTTLSAGSGYTTLTPNFRSDGEFQSALASGSTNFPMTVAPSMAWAEAGAVFQAQSSSQPSFTIATTAAPSTQLTTSNPKDIVVGVVDARQTTSPTAGTGYTLLATPVTAPTTITMGVEYEGFTAPQTDLGVGFGLGGGPAVAWIQYGDAIRGQVEQPVKLTVAEVGAAVATFSNSGCAASPGSVAGDGAVHNLFANPSCTLTLTGPSSSTNRWGFSSAGSFSATQTVATCSGSSGGGVCSEQDFTYYEQLMNTYEITPLAQTTWDGGLTFLVNGTQLGGFATVCTFTPSSGSGFQSCPAWADYNTAVTFPTNPAGAVSNTRWQASGSTSFTDTTGGNFRDVNYYKQLQNTYEATPNTNWDSSLSITPTGTLLGQANSNVCTILPTGGSSSPFSCTAYADYNAAVTYPALASGCPIDHCWVATGATSFSATTGGKTFNVNYDRGFPRSASDGFAVGDSPSRMVLLPRVPGSVFAFSGVASRTTSLSRGLGDVFSVLQSAVRSEIFGRSSSDFYHLADSAQKGLSLGRPLRDTYSVVESASRVSAIARQTTDPFRVTDSPVRLVASQRAAIGTFGFLESPISNVALARAASEIFSFLESAARNVGLTRAPHDTFIVTEVPNRLLQLQRNLGDTVAFSDVASRVLSLARGIADSFSFNDAVARLLTQTRLTIDPFPFSDVPSPVSSFVRSASDSFGLADSALRSLLFPRGPIESFSFFDMESRLVQLARSVGNSLPFSDLVSAVLRLSRSASDVFTSVESVIRNLLLVRLTPESYIVTDTVNRVLRLARAASDTLSFSDLTTGLLTLARMVSDSFSFGNLVARLLALSRAPFDLFRFSEVPSTISSLLRNVGDTFSVLDNALRTVIFSRAASNQFSFSDILSRLSKLVGTGGDAFSFLGLPTRLLSLERFSLDVFRFLETPTHLHRYMFQVTDFFNFGNSVARDIALFRSTLDAFPFATSVTRALAFLRSISDRAAFAFAAATLLAFSVAISDTLTLLQTALSTIRTTVQTTTTPGGGLLHEYNTIVFFFLPLIILLLIALILLTTYLRRRRKDEESLESHG